MAYRTRIKYTAAQRAGIWDRWQRGYRSLDLTLSVASHLGSLLGETVKAADLSQAAY